ncbi:MAG: hypothetical protein KY437_04180 [Actinobacteria bacterium]|nr:hypothetical protein [Actinomycetota bacterium]
MEHSIRTSHRRWSLAALRKAGSIAAVIAIPLAVLTTHGPDTSTVRRGSVTPAVAQDPTPAPRQGNLPPLETVLVFDDGQAGVVTVDFERGVIDRAGLPGTATDGRVRLGQLAGRIVVASGDLVWSIRPDTFAPTVLAQATTFLPDARPDRLWLVDEPDAHQEIGTWTLVDAEGQVLHQTHAREGMVPVRGVPDGLALSTDTGLRIYDLDRREVFVYVGAPDGWLGDAAAGRVVWCAPGCHRLAVTGGASDRRAVGADEVSAFETGSAWLSPDGTYVSAVARSVAAGVGTVRQVLAIDVETGEVSARRRLPNGTVHGGWSPDGQQFFLTAAAEDGALQLLRYRLGDRSFEAQVHDGTERLRSFIALPRSAVGP